jgi:hypothetical protein
MVAAMALPIHLVVLVDELAWGLSTGSLMLPTHVAMLAGVMGLMTWQRDRYAHIRHR